MKRALLGSKRKKAPPARKRAAKSPAPKAKRTRAPAKPPRKYSIRTALKSGTTKSRVQPARAQKRRAAKSSDVSTAPTKRPVAATRAAARKISSRRKRLSVTTITPRRLRRTSAGQVQPPLIPQFLLEGDEPPHPDASGPGEKYSLGPTSPAAHFDEGKAPLPESYGTGRLFLTARDPHWLYAHWDFTREEQFRYNARSMDRHLVLRVHSVAPAQSHVPEYHVHPESKHWFVHVEQAGAAYRTELGYYQTGRRWKSLTFSAPQSTPPDNISADTEVEFATIPLELPFETMLRLLQEAEGETNAQAVPLARGIEKIRNRTPKHLPKPEGGTEWTEEQAQALQQFLVAARSPAGAPSSADLPPGSAENDWPEFLLDDETVDSMPAAPPSSYVSSFFDSAKEFWFSVNAELIVYGATEPNASVTLAGKEIKLSSDGSFLFRFALPDGQYELPIAAVAADRTDGRGANLKFTRVTELYGPVTAHPQDPLLPLPVP